MVSVFFSREVFVRFIVLPLLIWAPAPPHYREPCSPPLSFPLVSLSRFSFLQISLGPAFQVQHLQPALRLSPAWVPRAARIPLLARRVWTQQPALRRVSAPRA